MSDTTSRTAALNNEGFSPESVPDTPLDELGGKQHDTVEPWPEDSVTNDGQYSFTDDVAKQFEEQVLPAQIPGYQLMRQRVLQVGAHFVKAGTTMLDLGTSQGATIRELIGYLVAKRRDNTTALGTRFLGVDSEEQQLAIGRRKLSDLRQQLEQQLGVRVPLDNVELRRHDLVDGLPEMSGYCSLITSVLTIQFVPVEYRQALVASIYNALAPGGALILVEKVQGNSSITDQLLQDIYYSEKSRLGMTDERIQRKRLSLAGFLVPKRSPENHYLLQQAGFEEFLVEPFWRDLQFEAVVAVKRPMP